MLTKSPVVQGRILDQRIDGVQVRWIKTFKYIKARSLRRIFSWLDFEVKVLLFGSKGLPAPEAVVVSSLSLLTILNGFLLRRKFGCKIIFEVRDIWPLTLIVEGNFSKFNPLVIALGFIEYLGYKFSDEIVGTMPNLKQHVDKVLRFSRQVHCIPIGFDCGDYRCPSKGHTGEITLTKPVAKFLIGYVGSIGVSNALDQLFQAAEKRSMMLQFIILLWVLEI